MRSTEGTPLRRSVWGALAGAGLGLLLLTGCDAGDGLRASESDITVEAADARESLEGVEVSESNPLTLYTGQPREGTPEASAASDDRSAPSGTVPAVPCVTAS